jgi:hypothetical protein
MDLCRGLAACGLAALLLTPLPDGSRAEDGWNPFAERDRRAARERRAEPPPAEPSANTLPPMDGVSSRPWARPDAGTPAQPQPYATPPAIASEPAPWDSRPREPVDARDLPPLGAPAEVSRSTPLAPVGSVVRSELSQPVLAGDGSGLPHNFWNGLDVPAAEELIAKSHVPPRSPALHDLWRRLWSSAAIASPAVGKDGITYPALRIEALYRSGLVADLGNALKQAGPAGEDSALELLAARSRIALGDRETGCTGVKAAHRAQAKLPKPLRSELILLAAYCGSASRDGAAAGLAANILRSERIEAPLALAALDSMSSKARKGLTFDPPRRMTLLDYRFLELAGWSATPDVVGHAEPALLAVLAASAGDPKVRILAAEAAARSHALSPTELADAWRAVQLAGADADPLSTAGDPATRRARLFKAIEVERQPLAKARLVRALLDDAGRAGLLATTAATLSTAISDMLPSAEIGWFAETAVEINLAAGRYDTVQLWAEPPSTERYGGHRHWMALADIADPKWRGRRGSYLRNLEEFALRGRLAPELMHRIVTVLDALDYQIPIPLWEAASRTPQPATGHLPETGVLSQLQDAAKKREIARTVLLAMRTLGPDAGDTAHMISLGDTIKSLKRAGLEREARRLGFEALFAGWPRSATN